MNNAMLYRNKKRLQEIVPLKKLILWPLALCGLFYPLLVLGAERPVVVTTIQPLALVLEDLGGDWLDVVRLLGDHQEPHHLALSFSQRLALEDAELILWVGPGLEVFLGKVMSRVSPKRQLSLEQIAADLDSDIPSDPHLWMQPLVMRALYRQLAESLGRLYPQHRQELQQRATQMEAALDTKLADLELRLAPLRHRPFVADHDAYSHFSDYFGLSFAGALVGSSGIATGARSLAALGSSPGIACVVVEQQLASKGAQYLAERLGAPTVVIDPLGQAVGQGMGGYVQFLESLGAGFERCLQLEDTTTEGGE